MPDAIVEFDNRVHGQQGDLHVYVFGHFVGYSHKYFAGSGSLKFADFLALFCNIDLINLSIYIK